jgi:hypothetical protein
MNLYAVNCDMLVRAPNKWEAMAKADQIACFLEEKHVDTLPHFRGLAVFDNVDDCEYDPDTDRIEELRTVLRSETISTMELIELQGLVHAIEPGDTEMLEAAGVKEFPDDTDL